MKNLLSLFITATMATSAVSAQEVIQVGKGSYASYTPLELCKSEYHEPGDWGFKGDQSKFMQYRKLYLREKEGQPIPTNDWWTNLITQPYSGRMWSYPQFVQAQSYGVDVQGPSYWMANGTEFRSNTVVSIKADGFSPQEAIAESWHDWDVEFSMSDGNKQMLTTMAHGMPFTWVEMTNISEPQVSISRSYQADGSFDSSKSNAVDASGVAYSNGVHANINSFALRMSDDIYGIYLPDNSTLTVDGGKVTVSFGGDKKFVVVAMLHKASELTEMAKFAYSVPRKTQVDWLYTAGTMKTTWNVDAVDLRTGGKAASDNVLQGFIPHQYRGTGNDCTLPFNGMTYATPHGKLKMAVGSNLDVSYRFYGILPYYAVPNENNSGKNPYREFKMLQMLKGYADKGSFGADTYWGGKGLTQMALNMMFAREMGEKAIFEQCRDKLKAALVNWLTYTPGEKNYFFARYDRWGAMVGYSTSYDSETFNDHHFHYGYFTYAAALLALVDDDFRNNYGDMITLIAKDYANWDREDNRFPMFRTFDPWAGHSFAGGMGDDNGNGQESSSEAMQGWGGLYLLGVALQNNEMRDAGIFGWLSEARGTAEYWFDRHPDDGVGSETYHTENFPAKDDYNIDYSKYKGDNPDNPEYYSKPIPYNSNLTCHGVGFWTYFGYDAIFMQGIQWMPISPALDYLSEDKAFAKWDFDRMWEAKRIGGWFKKDETFNDKGESQGYLGNSGGWGNVALSYLQRSNPEEAARIFDECWDAGEPEFKSYDTNGITYFVTHSHLTYGDIDWTVTASVPTARVYIKNGVKTYMAFNPTDEPVSVTFSDGARLENIPARRLAVSGVESLDNTEIAPDVDIPVDPREEIEMVNLALHKPVTSSGHENVGTVEENLTDGDYDTRWGSEHKDNQFVTVDLGENAYIYKLRLFWEVSYAAEYKVQISEDGKNFTDAKTVISTGGTEVVMMDDVKTRYIRIFGVKRSNQYGISLYELEAYGRLESMTGNDLLGFKLTCDDDVLKQNEPSQINIKGYTCNGNWVDVTPVWKSEDGKVTSTGEFTPAVYPRATVSATVGQTTVSKTFMVEEAIFVGYLELSPKETQIVVNDKKTIEVKALNQFKEPMKDCDLSKLEWTTYKGDADDKESWTVYNTALTVDDKVEVTANEVGEYYLAASAGVVTLPGQGDRIVGDTIKISAVKFGDLNLALNKPVTATSQESADMSAEKAVDGVIGTRWGSAWSGLSEAEGNAQNFTVDLQGEYIINKVKVYWETARAKKWELQVSMDGVEWQTIHTTEEAPKDEEITFPETHACYVRMHGITRNMGYGYSIYEFEVYGTAKLSDTSGIDIVTSDTPMSSDGVYSIDGRLVRTTGQSLSGLRPGLYIMNGKKIVKN